MHNEENIKTLRNLAKQVREYQKDRGWSDAKLCKEIASVGSSKTYKRILDDADDLDELNVENQLRNFQSAVEIITSFRQKDRPAEPEYEDFSNLERSETAVRRAALEDEDCVSRLVIIEGQTATGKDAVKRHLLRRFPNNSVAVEANQIWRMSPTTALLAIHNALCIVRKASRETSDLPKPPRSPRELLETIVSELKSRKLILIINEAHHMGVPGLNLVKTLLNMTPTVIVLECIPALLTRLLGSNYEEAVQLTGNRLSERVYLPTPPTDEILMMLDRRQVKFDSIEIRNAAAKQLCAEAPIYGNWAFVRQVTRGLYEASKKRNITARSFSDCISQVKNTRTRIAKISEDL